MINVTIFKDSSDEYRGFSLVGHAGYAESGIIQPNGTSVDTPRV